jgi:hypothetical protein
VRHGQQRHVLSGHSTFSSLQRPHPVPHQGHRSSEMELCCLRPMGSGARSAAGTRPCPLFITGPERVCLGMRWYRLPFTSQSFRQKEASLNPVTLHMQTPGMCQGSRGAQGAMETDTEKDHAGELWPPHNRANKSSSIKSVLDLPAPGPGARILRDPCTLSSDLPSDWACLDSWGGLGFRLSASPHPLQLHHGPAEWTGSCRQGSWQC